MSHKKTPTFMKSPNQYWQASVKSSGIQRGQGRVSKSYLQNHCCFSPKIHRSWTNSLPILDRFYKTFVKHSMQRFLWPVWWYILSIGSLFTPASLHQRLKTCATRNPPSLLTHNTHSSFDSWKSDFFGILVYFPSRFATQARYKCNRRLVLRIESQD